MGIRSTMWFLLVIFLSSCVSAWELDVWREANDMFEVKGVQECNSFNANRMGGKMCQCKAQGSTITSKTSENVNCHNVANHFGCTSWFGTTIVHKTTHSTQLSNCRGCTAIQSVLLWKAINVQYTTINNNFNNFKGVWIDVTKQALRILQFRNSYLYLNQITSYSNKWAGQLLRINFAKSQCAVLKFSGKATHPLRRDIVSTLFNKKEPTTKQFEVKTTSFPTTTTASATECQHLNNAPTWIIFVIAFLMIGIIAMTALIIIMFKIRTEEKGKDGDNILKNHMELTSQTSSDSETENRAFSLAESTLFQKSPSENHKNDGKKNKEEVYADPKITSDAMYIDPKSADGMYIEPNGIADSAQASQGVSYTPITPFNRDIYTQSQNTSDDQTLYTDLTQTQQDYESLNNNKSEEKDYEWLSLAAKGIEKNGETIQTKQNNGAVILSDDLYSSLKPFDQQIYN